MIKKILKGSIIWSIAAVIWLHIPVLNIPIIFLSMPLWDIAPFVSTTNEYVEWWFFGPIIKSLTAFITFSVYFWVVGIPVYLAIWFKKRKEDK